MADRPQRPSYKNSERGSLFLVGQLTSLPALLLVLMLAVLLGACQPATGRRSLTLSGPTMGTDFRITVVVEDDRDKDEFLQLVRSSLSAIEQQMSTYIPSSEISVFNNNPAVAPQQLSAQTAQVIEQALQVSRLTGGYFDITVGPLVNAWGFGPGGQVTRAPAPVLLAEISKSLGYELLELQGDMLSKANAGVQIDLSAIAKGYAVDQLAELFQTRGITDFLINVGGELRAAGKNIDSQLWRVGIEKPELLGGVAGIVELDNQAIATSGDYRNYVLIDGRKYSHTIDPLLQQPVRHQLALVSVISDRASTADALATALLAMGEEKALKFARQNGIAAYFVVRKSQEDGYDVEITPEFMPNLQ